MPSEITMPQLSDTMSEGTVVKWHKKEGEKVKPNEEIADIETDKATMPMEAFDPGTLAYIAVKEGQKVKVGELLAVIATAEEKPEEIRQKYASGAEQATGRTASPRPTPAPVKQTHGSTPQDAETDHPVQEEERISARRDQVALGTHRSVAVAEDAVAGNGGRVGASPLARRIAEEHGIDLAQVTGSGPRGRIIQRDILQFLEEGGAPAAAPGAEVRREAPEARAFAPIVPSGQKQTVRMTKMRSAIATALQRSKQNVPHFYETVDIDVEELSRARKRINERLEKEKVRLSIADFITRAVATALVRHPALNARFDAEKGEVTQYGDVNLGIAVAIPDGLIVPVLRGVNQMGLREIRERTEDLVERARAQRLKREEQTEATFTISSLGTYGIREFSAIINPPEVGILAVGAAERRPVARGDQILARMVMTVTLSCDHRVVDGAVAAEFLQTLKGLLEEPGMLLV